MNEFEQIDNVRLLASVSVRSKRQKLNEQYFTPGFVTNFIAEKLISLNRQKYNILDVASGVGNIGATVGLVVNKKCNSVPITLDAVEIDSELSKESDMLLSSLFNSTALNYMVHNCDFFDFYKKAKNTSEQFNLIVMNPPYKKLRRNEFDELDIYKEGVEYSPNLYSIMMSCALDLLEDNGELIAIVPRSFCSGALFHSFRMKIVKHCVIEFIHLFESRKKVFSFDGVQQETIIIKIVKRKKRKERNITISYGDDLFNSFVSRRSYSKVIFPKDNQCVIHIPYSEMDELILDRILSFKDDLESLGLKVSTGKIVDFRNKGNLTASKNNNAWLFCKENLLKDFFSFAPACFKNYLIIDDMTSNKLLDEQCHVVFNRMFFKEQHKVIVAQVVDCTQNDLPRIAVENHLNYISGKSTALLDYDFANGIKIYLESDLVSDYFRRFLGSTQINAVDIKSLPFPSRKKLIEIGKKGVFSYDE